MDDTGLKAANLRTHLLDRVDKLQPQEGEDPHRLLDHLLERQYLLGMAAGLRACDVIDQACYYRILRSINGWLQLQDSLAPMGINSTRTASTTTGIRFTRGT